MVLNSALLLLMRSIGATLLLLADTKIFLAYMLGDQLLYLVLKLVRGDLLHWLAVEGVGGLVMSLLIRIIGKTLTDFTGILELRGAGEMGGAMWLWTMFLALVTPWVAIPVYFGRLTAADANPWDFEQADALGMLAGFTSGWILAFAVFLTLMKREFRSTFWSTETGTEWIQAFFLHGAGDEIKQLIIGFNKGKWKAIEPQVTEWVGAGWLRWLTEKPDWFTENWKARVPEDWVPKEGKADHVLARRNSMARRNSLGDKIDKMRKSSIAHHMSHGSAKMLGIRVSALGGSPETPMSARRSLESRMGSPPSPRMSLGMRRASRVEPVIK
jgi:hypothetical protein